MQSMTSRNFKPVVAGALAALVLLVSVSPAMAQDAMRGYKDEGAAVQGQIQGSQPADDNAGDREEASGGDQPAKSTAGDGTLPFTGFETSVVLAMGLALAGLGFGLRRIARPPA